MERGEGDGGWHGCGRDGIPECPHPCHPPSPSPLSISTVRYFLFSRSCNQHNVAIGLCEGGVEDGAAGGVDDLTGVIVARAA